MILSVTAFGQGPEILDIQGDCDAAVETVAISDGRQCSANHNWTAAVDVIVPADKNLTLNSITPSLGMQPGTTATSVLVSFYNNANGVPGNLIGTPQTITPTSSTYKGSQFGMDFSDVLLELDPVTFSGSAGSELHYWIAMQITTSSNTDGYIEQTSETALGFPLAFSDGNLFVIPNETKDGVYSLSADCMDIEGAPFPFPYCGTLVFGTVEPITYVEVAGISNSSSAVNNGTPAHEDFVDVIGEMAQGANYSIVLEGNTSGNYSNYFVVFVDWNQNNILDDAGEVYEIFEPLVNSTGTDGKQIIGEIAVPADALLGTTRMRIKKTYNEPYFNPCEAENNWGQTEDYSILVTQDLGITANDVLDGFSFYPNPSSDLIYLTAKKNIESVIFYNILGQQVFIAKPNASSAEINVSQLNEGTYILKVNIAGETGTYKFVKN